MHLGVDFDGTIIRYVVCAASEGGDGHVIANVEKFEAAQHELRLAVGRAKRRKHSADEKFWVMKQTFKYERVLECHIEESES